MDVDLYRPEVIECPHFYFGVDSLEIDRVNAMVSKCREYNLMPGVCRAIACTV